MATFGKSTEEAVSTQISRGVCRRLTDRVQNSVISFSINVNLVLLFIFSMSLEISLSHTHKVVK